MARRLFFSLFIILFIFSFFQVNYLAQEISPTPEPGKEGGRCKPVLSGNEILDNVSIPKFSTPDDTNQSKWGCIRFFFIETRWCISELFNSAKKEVNEFLNTDELLKELGILGVCDSGLEPSTIDVNSPDCICINPNTRDLSKLSDWFCNKYIRGTAQEKINSKEFIKCSDCFSNGGYYSAIGCIYFSDWKTFFEKNIFGTLIGLAGFIALICIIYSAFQLQLSQGSAEKIKKAQELLTSCIMGLMLIIFSVFILRLIGVDILKIPGFGK